MLAILRVLLPRACPGCGADLGTDRGLCAPCAGSLRPTIVRESVLQSGTEPHLVVLGRYDGVARRAVRALKFSGSRELAALLAGRLAPVVPGDWRVDTVCAVPLHVTRLAARGYNQAELLARPLAHALGVHHRELLVRSRDTRQQARLNRERRSENVAGAFRASQTVRGRVLLVDDVLTTGATLRACASALHEAGAEAVYFGVVAL